MGLIDRYSKINIILDSNKKRSYATNMYPSIDKDINDIYVITDVTDRLDILAFQYYNNSSYWWIIAQANNLGKGSFNIPPGTYLRIPTNLNKILSDYEIINTRR